MKHLVAVATHNPFGLRTFSGLASNLFVEIQRRGIVVHPIRTRDLRWYDAVTGAVNWKHVLNAPSRKASRISPNWYWSRSTNELMTRRFRERLLNLPGDAPVLQIGTHVQAAPSHRRIYCLTDLTVSQALAAGRNYQLGRASASVGAQAHLWQKEIFDACEKIFVLSNWAWQSVVEDYQQPTAKVITVGAGANVPSDLPIRNPSTSSPTILFVGMDWEQKGGALLLRAFRRVRKVIPNAQLSIIGCHPKSLENEVGVNLIGRLDRTRAADEACLLQAYATACCFCIVPEIDAFPNVLLEAAAFGLPVVSTDCGSRSEVIENGVTGFLVPVQNEDLLADAIIKLIQDPRMAARMGEEAAARVEKRFRWPIVATKILHHMGLNE